MINIEKILEEQRKKIEIYEALAQSGFQEALEQYQNLEKNLQLQKRKKIKLEEQIKQTEADLIKSEQKIKATIAEVGAEKSQLRTIGISEKFWK